MFKKKSDLTTLLALIRFKKVDLFLGVLFSSTIRFLVCVIYMYLKIFNQDFENRHMVACDDFYVY